MMRKGTTLLELIIAMGVIITGLLTVLGLIVRSIQVGTLTKNELVATMIAQEGIEAVRSIRDSNGLEIQAGKRLFTEWDSNLFECITPDLDGSCPESSTQDFTGVIEVSYDYDDPQCGTNESCIVKTVWVMDFSPDAIDDAPVFQYTSAADTPGLFVQRAAGIAANMKETQFHRLLTLEPLCDDSGDPSPLSDMISLGSGGLSDAPPCPTGKLGVRIMSEVRWLEEGNARDVILSEDVYDWR